MNNKIVLVLTVIIHFNTPLLVAEITNKKNLPVNRLALLLEEDEGTGENFSSAVSYDLSTLLIQKSTPIFTTTALWDRFVLLRQFVFDVRSLERALFDKRHENMKRFLGKDSDTAIQAILLQLKTLDAYKDDNTSEATNLSNQLKQLLTTAQNRYFIEEFNKACLFTSRIPFNQEDWYCTRFGDRFLLLVPKTYADKMGTHLGLSLKKEVFPNELMDLTATYHRFKDRLKKNLLKSLPVIGHFTTKETPLGKEFLKIFDTLFDMERITKMRINETPLRWVIFLSGHGEQERVGIQWKNKEAEGEAQGLVEYLEKSEQYLSKALGYRYEYSVKSKEHPSEEYYKNVVQIYDDQVGFYNSSINETLQNLNDLISKQKKVKKIEGIVASFTIPEFKTLLKYLSQKIDTAMFAYLTCFSASSNLYKTFQHDQEALFVEKHPFIIAMGGVTAGSASAPGVKDDFENYPPLEEAEDIARYKEKEIIPIANTELFFSAYDTDEPVDWEKVFDGIFAYSKFPSENIPLVKFPGTEWFTVPALKDVALQISNVMAATRDPKKSLILENQKVILLYAPHIPFSINYAKRLSQDGAVKQEPLFVSMAPGNAFHRLKHIDANQYEASRVLRSFFNYPDVLNEKAFFIETMSTTNDILPELQNSSSELKNVLCIHNAQLSQSDIKKIFSSEIPKNSSLVCFTFENSAYGWIWPNNGRITFSGNPPEKINPDYTTIFNAYTAKKYPKQEGFAPEKRESLIKVLKKKRSLAE